MEIIYYINSELEKRENEFDYWKRLRDKAESFIHNGAPWRPLPEKHNFSAFKIRGLAEGRLNTLEIEIKILNDVKYNLDSNNA